MATAAILAAIIGLYAPPAAAGSLDPRSVTRSEYDGVADDLLTGGLGIEGLRSAQPPGFADPRVPTPRELRRRAIWQNYRALIDLSPGGGAGKSFGPRDAERIGGIEYLGAVREAPGEGVTHSVLLQIPRSFDPQAPCLIAVASSGSRGIWGALPTAGEWGLRRGCAVVHTDKATGTGFFDVDGARAQRIDGTVTTDPDDPRAQFVPLRDGALERRRAQSQHEILVRHAQSGRNPESRWGQYLIEATTTAFDWLNTEYATRRGTALTPANTLVIASGISNGGGVVLRALEADRGDARVRWFDGAVVAEPNITVRGRGRPIYDYASLAALLQPCAVLAEPDASAPLLAGVLANRAVFEAWCEGLARGGEVRGADAPARAADARAQLIGAGYRPESLALAPLQLQAQVWTAVVSAYAAAYSRKAPSEPMPCGLSYAFADATGRPRAAADEEWARLYADSNGIPPTAGIALLRGAGPARSVASALELDAARCLRAHFGDAALRRGLAEIEVEAQPGDRPVIVLHGRADGLVLPQHSSQAWYARAASRETKALRYYELVHAQHFDAFLALPAMAQRYVPMQPWLLAAMDAMDARLRRARALPPSQVLRVRAGESFGGIPTRPAPADRIAFTKGELRVPE